MPGGVLVVGLASPRHRAQQLDADEPMLGLGGLEPDVGDLDLAGVEASGRDDEPHLAAVERDRRGSVDRRAGDLAGRRVDARGQVDASTGAAAALIRSMSAAASARGSPVKPVPKSASTITSGVAELRLARLRVDDPRLATGLLEVPRHDAPVAAVRAAAADDRPARGVREAAKAASAASAPARSISSGTESG